MQLLIEPDDPIVRVCGESVCLWLLFAMSRKINLLLVH